MHAHSRWRKCSFRAARLAVLYHLRRRGTMDCAFCGARRIGGHSHPTAPMFTGRPVGSPEFVGGTSQTRTRPLIGAAPSQRTAGWWAVNGFATADVFPGWPQLGSFSLPDKEYIYLNGQSRRDRELRRADGSTAIDSKARRLCRFAFSTRDDLEPAHSVRRLRGLPPHEASSELIPGCGSHFRCGCKGITYR